MPDRIGLEIGKRGFRFGDPYFRCPHCGEHGFYNDRSGQCYKCKIEYLVAQPSNGQDPKVYRYAVIGASLLLAAAIVWVTEPGTPKPWSPRA